MAFLKDIEMFRGTGEKNKKGQGLEEFLEEYNPKKYDCPSNTVDMLVLRSEKAYTSFGQPLKLLLVRRGNHPSIGFWALPGGFVELRENLLDAAKRELMEETGVSGIPLVQLRTWGEVDRDPRWRVITTAFLALVEGELPVKAGDDAADAAWFDITLKEEDDGCYRLELVNAKKNLRLGAVVQRNVFRQGILEEESYRMVSSDRLASDHGALIVQALLYLKNREKTD